jgi:hypothetical protein
VNRQHIIIIYIWHTCKDEGYHATAQDGPNAKSPHERIREVKRTMRAAVRELVRYSSARRLNVACAEGVDGRVESWIRVHRWQDSSFRYAMRN